MKKIKANPYKNTLNEVQDFWKNPDWANQPVDYFSKIERSEYLVNELLIKRLSTNKDSNILELGCNCGRNLNYLEKKGYTSLTGIEISKNAIDFGKRAYLDLKANIINDSIENIIKDFKVNSFNVVFTMAVLMHIHNDSMWIFEEMKRISNGYIIIIEDNIRDYKKIFEKSWEFRSFYEKTFFQVDEHKTNKFYDCSDKYTTRIFELRTYETEIDIND